MHSPYLAIATPAAGVVAATVYARFQRLTSCGSHIRGSDCVWPLCLPVADAGSLLIDCHVGGWYRCCLCWRPTQEASKAREKQEERRECLAVVSAKVWM